MIFLRAAQRELTQTAAAVFVVLFAIMITTQLIRLLNQAAGGATAPEAVAALLGFAAINYLPVLLAQTLFITILLVLTRVYRDSEMVVWFSSGLPLTAWVRPVLRFAWPIVAVIAGLTLFLAPWAYEKRDEYQAELDRRGDVARITPGAFRESSDGNRIFFVEAVEEGETAGIVRNVFVSAMQHGRSGVMVAASGRIEVADNGDRFVVLEQGRRYEGEAGQSEFRVMEFSRYAIRIEAKEARLAPQEARNLPTHELLRDWTRVNQGELMWRLGIPLSALTLALLAIPLSFVNPRAGRTGNLLFAILVFLVYSNLLSASRAWLVQGKLSFGIAVWLVHLLMFAVLLILFWRRLAVFSVWRRR
ncbi:MAG: LPS export ABC transporter permease LptF [Rhodocyclaceae bacterium]|nr:LPS export ABC transporter permease LptF [Rhodocyclaceae bacterium]